MLLTACCCSVTEWSNSGILGSSRTLKMHLWDPSQWNKMCFEYERIKIQWKNGSRFSNLLTVRACCLHRLHCLHFKWCNPLGNSDFFNGIYSLIWDLEFFGRIILKNHPLWYGLVVFEKLVMGDGLDNIPQTVMTRDPTRQIFTQKFWVNAQYKITVEMWCFVFF